MGLCATLWPKECVADWRAFKQKDIYSAPELFYSTYHHDSEVRTVYLVNIFLLCCMLVVRRKQLETKVMQIFTACACLGTWYLPVSHGTWSQPSHSEARNQESCRQRPMSHYQPRTLRQISLSCLSWLQDAIEKDAENRPIAASEYPNNSGGSMVLCWPS